MQPPVTIKELEAISTGMKRGWLFEKQVVVYQVSDTDQETVDTWVKTVIETSKNWPSETPYLEIQDMQNLGVTPYSREKAKELSQIMANQEGYSAIIVSDNFLGQAIRFAVNYAFPRLGHTFKRRVFTNWNEAVTWIITYVKNT